MKRYYAGLLPFFALCIVAQFFCAPGSAIGAEGRFSLTISAERPVVTVDDSIMLRVTLTNTSGEQVPFGYWGDEARDLDVEATMADGRPAPESRSARKRNADPYAARSWITGTIPVGGGVSWQVNVDDFFDATAPGTYTFRVSFPAKSAVPVLSNFVVVTVNPVPAESGPAASDVLKAAGALYPKATALPMSLDIDADRTVKAGQVVVRYELTNTSGQTITFAPGTVHQFAVDVRDQNGDLVSDREANRLQKERLANNEGDPDIRPSQPGAVKSIPRLQLASGPVFLDRLVDVSKPGIYSVQLWKKLPAEAGGGEVRSNVIVIRIKQ